MLYILLVGCAMGQDGAVVDELVNGDGLVNGGGADTKKGGMGCWDG